MEALDILYDHYKEKMSFLKEAQSRRNRSFLLLCVLEALSFLLLIRPERAIEVILSGIEKELDFTLALSITIIQTLLWLLIVYVMIRYVQDTIFVEREYQYLGNLEKELCKQLKSSLFSHEGESYLNNYPMVLNLIDLYYKTVMPILFAVINSVRIYKEWHSTSVITIALICDTVLFISILVVDWFYFFEIHRKTTEFFKKHILLVDKIATKLRAWLKAV